MDVTVNINKQKPQKLWVSSPCKINVLEFYLEKNPLKKGPLILIISSIILT